MPECPYHAELDQRIRDVETAKVLTMEHHSDIKILFRGADDHAKTLNEVQLTINTMHNNLFNSMNMLKAIQETLDSNVEKIAVIGKESEDFRWFSTQINWLRNKLPWWLAGIAVVGLAIMLASHSEAIKATWKLFVKD